MEKNAPASARNNIAKLVRSWIFLLAAVGVVACGSSTQQQTGAEQTGELLERRREASFPPSPPDEAYAVHVPDDEASEAARHALDVDSLPKPRASHDLMLILHGEWKGCPLEFSSFEVDSVNSRLRLEFTMDEFVGCAEYSIPTLYAIGWPGEEASQLTTVTVDENGDGPGGETAAQVMSAQEFADEFDEAP